MELSLVVMITLPVQFTGKTLDKSVLAALVTLALGSLYLLVCKQVLKFNVHDSGLSQRYEVGGLIVGVGGYLC